MYICTNICTHTHIHTYICRFFFFRSPVGGYLGCFHVFTVENSASRKIGVHISF